MMQDQNPQSAADGHNPQKIRIAICVGEASGDLLGASLISALKKIIDNLEVFGIIGPKLTEMGCRPFAPMSALAVMGLVEVIGKIPKILKIRRQFLKALLASPPDLFIGIDAPDFNLALEQKLKTHGVKILHYVSPTVWAWRPGRLKRIQAAVSHILLILPFEQAIYDTHGIPATYVGHPLADQMVSVPNKQVARETCGLSSDKPVLAILPGSRQMEIDKLGELFLETAKNCITVLPHLQIISVMCNEQRAKQFQQLWESLGKPFPLTILQNCTQEVVAASDVVLVASGTATLEILLLNRPMVVAYRVTSLTYRLLQWLVRTSHVALPNILANARIVPELIQSEASVTSCTQEVLKLFTESTTRDAQIQAFQNIQKTLQCQASDRAAEVVKKLLFPTD